MSEGWRLMSDVIISLLKGQEPSESLFLRPFSSKPAELERNLLWCKMCDVLYHFLKFLKYADSFSYHEFHEFHEFAAHGISLHTFPNILVFATLGVHNNSCNSSNSWSFWTCESLVISFFFIEKAGPLLLRSALPLRLSKNLYFLWESSGFFTSLLSFHRYSVP